MNQVSNRGVNQVKSIAVWSSFISIPVCVYFLAMFLKIEPSTSLFLSLLSAASIMWSSSYFPEYIPGLFVIMSALFLGIAPQNLILSGFSSEVFMMVFSMLCLSTVIVKSRIMIRALYHLLHLIRYRPQYFDKAFFFLCSAVSPILATVSGRLDIACQGLSLFVQKWDLHYAKESTTQFVVSAFHGASALATTCLSASLLNYVVLGLLPLHEQLRYSFWGWMKGSFASLLIIAIGFFTLRHFFFPKKVYIEFAPHQAKVELQKLGPLSSMEIGVFLIMAISIISTITYPIHKIYHTWIALGLVYVMFVFDMISVKSLKEDINWPFLIFLASIIGIAALILHFSLDHMLLKYMQPYVGVFKQHVYMFFGVVVTSCLLLRLILPEGAAVAILLPVYMILANVCGIETWTVTYTLLLSANCWFFPYQNSPYGTYKAALKDSQVLFDEKKFIIFNTLMSFVKILSIFASIYYWQNIINTI